MHEMDHRLTGERDAYRLIRGGARAITQRPTQEAVWKAEPSSWGIRFTRC